ncbi:GNAT family N-acetyltransferase [Chitinophagaceae bacterium LWZ2-11]
MFLPTLINFPVLTTERLVLRHLTNEDALPIHSLRSNEEVNKYLDRAPSTDIADALAFIRNIGKYINSQASVYWAITLKNDNTLIGTVCFWNFDLENETIELGYELLPAFQGKGIMAEAVRKVILYGFNEMKAATITASPSADNAASKILLEKAGFIFNSHDSINNMLTYTLNKKGLTQCV